MIPTGFDPSKYMPQNPGIVGFEGEDSPEKAGAVARDWSEKGIQPTMTNLPQEANSNQIAFDAMGKQPSEEDLALSQELDRFDRYYKKKLDERFGGDLSGVDPSMEAERAAERFIRSKLPNVPFAEENINPEYIKQANEVYKATFRNLAGQKSAYQQAYLQGLNQFTQDYKNGKFQNKRTLKGFDHTTNKPVYLDNGALAFEDGTPYEGGQLLSPTEGAQQAALRMSTKPEDMEKLADAVESGRNTISNIAKGMGGAHTAREVGKILEGRGVDVTSIDLNIASKRSAQTALEKTVNQLKPFEETAKRNLSYANELSKKYVRSKYPLFNKLVVAWDSNTGDPEVEKFKIATYDGMAEAMKHMMAGSGITAAELSVGAQEQAKKLLNATQSWQQFDAVIQGINVGLKNRSESYRNRLEYLKNQPVTKFDPEKQETEWDQKMIRDGKDTMHKLIFGSTSNKPSNRQEYFNGLKQANPNASDKEINEYLDKKGIR